MTQIRSPMFRLASTVFTSLALCSCGGGLARGIDALPPQQVQWVTLGTSGGPAVQVHRSQIANALVVGDAIYLFDTGNGVQRQIALAGLNEQRVKAIFITHHHVDHNADLGPLLVTHWTFGRGVLPVFGPVGTRQLAEGLAAANAPTALAAFPTSGPLKPPIADVIAVTDLPRSPDQPVLVFEDANVRVTAIGVDHFQQAPSVALPEMPDALAYRVEAGGRSFVFTGDSGPSPRLAHFMQGADVLITEIVEPTAIAALLRRNAPGASDTVREAIITGMRVNHLEPEEIGRMAAAAGVGEIVLTHFVPSPEDSTDPDAYVRGIRETFTGPVRMAKDLDRF